MDSDRIQHKEAYDCLLFGSRTKPPCHMIKQACCNHELLHTGTHGLREDWFLKSPQSSSSWVSQNLSRHMIRQACFNHELLHTGTHELRENWRLRGPRSSSFWVSRNLSRHMIRQDCCNHELLHTGTHELREDWMLRDPLSSSFGSHKIAPIKWLGKPVAIMNSCTKGPMNSERIEYGEAHDRLLFGSRTKPLPSYD
jgi:hypothetical protein